MTTSVHGEAASQIVRLVTTGKPDFLAVRHVSAEAVIDGPMCRSNLRIIFSNELGCTVEANLVFPLPPFAALCLCVGS